MRALSSPVSGAAPCGDREGLHNPLINRGVSVCPHIDVVALLVVSLGVTVQLAKSNAAPAISRRACHRSVVARSSQRLA